MTDRPIPESGDDQPDPVADVFDRWAPPICDVMDDPVQFNRVAAELPEDTLNLISANMLYGEVLNGGFHQYFCNSFGITVDVAIRGLEAIGLREYAELGREAKAVFGPIFPAESMKRFQLVGHREGLGLVFASQTDRFIDLANSNENRDRQAFDSYAAAVLRRHSN